MKITLNKKTEQKVKVASKKLGLDEKQFINASIVAYLSEMQNAINLKKELSAWDMLSGFSLQKNNF